MSICTEEATLRLGLVQQEADITSTDAPSFCVLPCHMPTTNPADIQFTKILYVIRIWTDHMIMTNAMSKNKRLGLTRIFRKVCEM